MKDVNVPAGYKSTDVGVIPKNWKVKKLKFLIKIINGFAFKSEFFSTNGVIVLTPGNFKLEGGLYFNEKNTKRYSGKFPLSTKFNFGDLLIVMTDLTRECNLLGKPALIDTHETILHNQRIGKIETLTNEVIKNFLFFFFLSNYYHLKVKETATGSTVRHTSNRSIYDISFALPPLPEQKAIARVLSDVDELIRECDSLLAKKRDIKQGTMQQLLTGKKRLPGFGGEWEVHNITKCCQEVFLGLTAKVDYVKYGGVPLIRATDISNGKLSFQNALFISNQQHKQLTKYRKAKYGDVLVSKSGSLGVCALVNTKKEFSIYESIIVLQPILNKLNSGFLLCSMNFQETQKRLLGGIVGSTVGHLNLNLFKQLEIPLPTLPEQKAIAKILSDMDAEIEALEQKRDKYKAIKQGMMQELLTGKTRLIDRK